MSYIQESDDLNIWRVLPPKEWPKEPSWMSFSTLRELETCPRRWALKNAAYPQIWRGHGYPRTLRQSAIEGTIIHLSLQTITKALVENGCSSLAEENAILGMKRLGGFSEIIIKNIDRALQPYIENPRVNPFIAGIRDRLINEVPNMRVRILRHLSRVHIQPSIGKQICEGNLNRTKVRHILEDGSFSEVELRALSLMWLGVADLITIGPKYCEIRDFKTGAAKEDHILQIRLYALLWAKDQTLNPSGRHADKLILSYDNSDVEISVPNEKEMTNLEDELKKRITITSNALRADPPKALPAAENCLSCSVKHLCNEYWEWNAGKYSFQEQKKAYADFQIKLIGKHGLNSWDCVAESLLDSKGTVPVLLRISNLPIKVCPGYRLRILNSYISVPIDDYVKEYIPIIFANIGTNCEAFLFSS